MPRRFFLEKGLVSALQPRLAALLAGHPSLFFQFAALKCSADFLTDLSSSVGFEISAGAGATFRAYALEDSVSGQDYAGATGF